MRYALETQLFGKWVSVAHAGTQSHAEFLAECQRVKWAAIGALQVRVIDTDCGEAMSTSGDDEMAQPL